VKRHRIGAGRKLREARVYANMHRDFKTLVDGKKSVLILRNGVTLLCPVDKLTDAELLLADEARHTISGRRLPDE
jgi:hypothetical protein